MKINRLSSIIFLIIAVVLVATIFAGCGGSVDEEYQYNTVIETNENMPVVGEPEIEKITGYVEDKDQKFLKLPYAIENTDLEIVSIGKYSNATISEETDKEILALVVKNTSDQVVSFSTFNVKCDSKLTTTFSPTNLPAGMSALVYCESPYVAYEDVEILEISEPMAVMSDSLPMLDGVVGVDYKDGNFIITNLTDEKLGDVYVRYKNCSDGNVFLGGTTYSSMASDVGAYETYTVPAEYYVEGSSVIIAVENYIMD